MSDRRRGTTGPESGRNGRLPDALGAVVARWYDELRSRHGDSGPSGAADVDAGLEKLVACSDFAADALLRDAELLAEARAGRLELPSPDRLRQEMAALADDAADRQAFMRALRQVRTRNLVRILWHETVASGDVAASLEALSLLAEGAVDQALQFAVSELAGRFGYPVIDGEQQPLIVLAMGKLGGGELNFSSDIDLIFLYPADCETDGHRSLSAQEYFGKLVRAVISLLEEPTADGFVYRVDTRLRPFGASGPPVIGFAALESYLVEHGRGWERYAYVKARPVTATATCDAAGRLMSDIIRPFVYRRYLDYGVFESLRDMQALIAAEVRKREMADNIKLGPGGIREIEFIVQSLQLVRGGNVAELQTTRLYEALDAAVDDHDLGRGNARRLRSTYDFLRRVENLLQAVRDRQVHILPEEPFERERLAFAAGFGDWPALSAAIEEARGFVAEQFQAIGIRDSKVQEADERRAHIERLWSARAMAGDWLPRLQALGIGSAEEVARVLGDFGKSGSPGRADAVSARRLRRFMGNLLVALPRCRNPATALKRVLDIADAVLRRSAYLALLNENPRVLERLVDLCDSSFYLATELARYPALLDELIDARIFEQAPTTAELAADLEASLEEVPEDDFERRIEALAEFKRSALFRIAVADFGGSIPIMKVSDRLTEIAEMILRAALDTASRDLVRQFGVPCYRSHGRRHRAELGIVAYGKLAGYELSYSSDLDIVFVHDSSGESQQTDGPRSVDNSVFFSRLVRRLMHLLSTQTGSGALYEIDTRLRPSGRSGLLVTSIEAFERYQEENAWTWEHQALLRSRPVAGSAIVAREFERIRARTLKKRVRRGSLADDVSSMRARMRAELDSSDHERFDLKQGRGGIADIEFLVQYLVLLSADRHPALIHYTDNIRQLGTLAAAGCVEEASVARLQNAYRNYRARLHRLALDNRPATVAADEFASDRDFVAACWRGAFGQPPP